MGSDHDERDPERDAWLRAALRHAPDAGVGAPASVTQTILHQARAATVSVAARQPARSTEPPLQNFWSWLWRPSVAAGFASVMVATVVGLMWWDRPMEEALPPREAQMDTAAAPPTASATVTATAESARPDALPSRAAVAPAAARKAAPAVVAPPPALPAPALQRDLATAKSAAPAGAAAPAQPNPSTAVADAAPRARESAERRELASAPAAPATLNMAAQADAAAPAAAAPRAAAAKFISTPGLSNLRFEVRGRPQAWSWQRDDGEAREIDDALQDWIVQADRVAHPQWTHGTSAGGITATLRFTRGGVVRAVLRIGPAGLQLTRGGKTESAELTAGQAAALLSGLDALGR